MSKLTPYTCIIESVDSMGFPLQTERTVYLASDVDALLSPPCGTCGGTRVIDSGGVTQWDAPIDIPCPDCSKPPGEGLTRDIAHNLIDEWHETTEAAAGDSVGYSESEWTELGKLIAKALNAHLATLQAELEGVRMNYAALKKCFDDNPHSADPEVMALAQELADYKAQLREEAQDAINAKHQLAARDLSLEGSLAEVAALEHHLKESQQQLASLDQVLADHRVAWKEKIETVEQQLAAREGQVTKLEEALKKAVHELECSGLAHDHPCIAELSKPLLPKFDKTFCSQCGGEFGPGDHGFSHCSDHSALAKGAGALPPDAGLSEWVANVPMKPST